MESNKNVSSNPKKTQERIVPVILENDSNDSQNNISTSLTSLTLNESSLEDKTKKKESDSSLKQEEPKGQKNAGKECNRVILPIRELPAQNVPERIVICLDTCEDPSFTAFTLDDGTKYSPIYMLKRTVEIFVQNKNFIDPRHEFALLTLNKTGIKWVQEFTNNPRDIINTLADINESEQDAEIDLSLLLDEIWKNVTVPKPNKNLTIPPSFVVRLILLYNRSYCTPIVKKDFIELLSNPYFTVDVIMTHEEKLVDNKCQEIFNNLQKLDNKGFSYHFEIGRNPHMLHDCMAKLLAHPLQRAVLGQAQYKIQASDLEAI